MLKVLNHKSFDKSELLIRASERRHAAWGKIVTYSRKVFVPLTNMCRDTCSYCTFVKHPNSKSAQILNPESVLEIVRLGERSGCKEVLLSLGEKPELRYEKAREELKKLGFSTMVGYLKFVCQMILRESTLLPHVNAGTLSEDEISSLKPVAASMGMMLESVSRRLTKRGMPHFACPDKIPVQRIRTMNNMGMLKVPFTTGVLIGIGESWDERIETLKAIEDSHRKYNHIQEVIVQNFVPKPDIKMRNFPGPDQEEMLITIALARLILSPEISIQSPPNLSAYHVNYLDAGLNDWGGISPVTDDYINPEKTWPRIEELRASTKSKGFELQERLTVYPRFQNKKDGFLSPNMFRRVTGLRRKDGLARKQCC
ncbi:MAG: 7,8-didemethyl-8-hydroxy-5-deazariboflavin synthase subunit CofG [Rhodobacteraceae bacterium]|nr:MAG: 7,8-didemethyl-8-hydroxy-5-deazariboflavin synthase subunit CofG [Paracoccaceae bacterium]